MHIDLWQRKRLAAKLLLWQIQQLLRAEFDALGHVSLLDEVERLFESALPRRHEELPNCELLDAFLEKFFANLEQAAIALNQAHRTVISEIFRAALPIRQQIVCDQCVSNARGTQVCCGNLRDYLAVSSGGRCIGPIRELFELGVALAERYYRTFSSNGSALTPPSMRLATSSSVQKPHGIPVQYFVGGEATMTEVRLILWMSEFDRKSYVASFYVLAHELIVHAYAGIGGGTHLQPRELPSEDDPFAEGWMDFVVEQVLDHAFTEGQLPTTPIADASEFKDAGTRFHLARTDLVQSLRDQGVNDYSPGIVANRSKGKKAARCASQLMRCALGNRPRAIRMRNLFRLSFDLNLLNLRSSDREMFVTLLARIPEGALGLSNTQVPHAPSHMMLIGNLLPFFKRYVQREISAEELFWGVMNSQNPV